jgi:hypothetical protein
MSRLTDAAESFERDLGKYRGDSESDLLNRRFIIRRALEIWGREQFDLGHGDGMRDVHDTQRQARRLADEAAEEEGNDGG